MKRGLRGKCFNQRSHQAANEAIIVLLQGCVIVLNIFIITIIPTLAIRHILSEMTHRGKVERGGDEGRGVLSILISMLTYPTTS